MQQKNTSALETLIQAELEQLQPYIASHGGSIKFVRLQDQFVYVTLHGTCQQCPLSFYTLTYGIERQLKSKISLISRVEAINQE